MYVCANCHFCQVIVHFPYFLHLFPVAKAPPILHLYLPPPLLGNIISDYLASVGAQETCELVKVDPDLIVSVLCDSSKMSCSPT